MPAFLLPVLLQPLIARPSCRPHLLGGLWGILKLYYNHVDHRLISKQIAQNVIVIGKLQYNSLRAIKKKAAFAAF